MSIPYERAVEKVLDQVPEFRPEYEALQAGPSRDLPHPIFGGLTAFVIKLLENGKGNRLLLKRVFRILEELSSSEDIRTRALVQVSFLENLGKESWALKTAVPLMGQRTRTLSDAVEEFVRTGRVELLEAQPAQTGDRRDSGHKPR